MSYFQDNDASQIRGLKDKLDKLQADFLSSQFSIQQENQESGQGIFAGANPSARSGGSGGGGSGSDDPLIRGRVDHGTIGLVSENIDISEFGGNTHVMTINGDVTFGFTGAPTAGRMERFIMHIVMDSNPVPHVISWPGTLIGPPTLDTSPNAINNVEIYTYDGGLTYHPLSVSSGSGGASNLWSNIVIDVLTKDMMAGELTNLSGLKMTGVVATPLTATETGIVSDANGGLSFNLGGLSGQYNFGMNADASPRLQINNASLISQSIFPVDSTPITGDELGSTGNEWARLSVTDIVLKAGANNSKLIFDGDAATPATYFTGSDIGGTVHFFSDIGGIPTNVMSFTNSNLGLFGNTDLILDTGQIRAGGPTKGVENIGQLTFIDNTSSPAAPLAIYSDGTDLFANTGGIVVNLTDVGNHRLSELVIDVNKDWATMSITNMAAIQYVDTGAVPRGTISGDAVSSAIRLSTASGGNFVVSDVITDIAQFSDLVGLEMLGTHVINMHQNNISEIGQTQYDRTIGFAPALENAIGFDNTSNFLKYNVGLTSDSHAWYAGGELLSSMTRVAANSGQLNIDNVIADNLLQTNGQLFFTTSATPAPLFDGAIWRDTSGIFKARQNGITENLIGGSGGSGINFPIRHNITDAGTTWSNPVSIDLTGDADKHTWKWTLDQDLTFGTLNNLPALGVQHTFELEFQHDGSANSYVVTLPANFIDEKGNTLSSFTLAPGNFAILTCRINNGTDVLVVQKNVTTTVGTGNFATTALDNLASPILNTSIDFNSNAPTNFNGYVSQIVGNSLVNNTSGATWSLPTGDIYDFKVNGTSILNISSVGIALGLAGAGSINVRDNFITMADITTPASPSIGERRMFVDSGTGELSVRTSGGTTISLEGGGGSSSLNGLSDVTLASVLDNQFLQFNSGTGQWENVSVTPGSGLQNVVEDPTPELGGDLDALGNRIDNVLDIVSDAAVPASSGSSNVIRLGNQQRIAWRNAANTADIYIRTKSTNAVEINEDFLPSSTNTRSLGVNSFRWSTLWCQAIECSNTLQVDGTANFGGNVTLGNQDSDNVVLRGNVDRDIQFNIGNTVDFNGSKSSGTSGTASALPAGPPQTYVEIRVNGTTLYIPAYNA